MSLLFFKVALVVSTLLFFGTLVWAWWYTGRKPKVRPRKPWNAKDHILQITKADYDLWNLSRHPGQTLTVQELERRKELGRLIMRHYLVYATAPEGYYILKTPGLKVGGPFPRNVLSNEVFLVEQKIKEINDGAHLS